MAVIAHVSAIVLASDIVEPVSKEELAELKGTVAVIGDSVNVIQGDYVTSQNVGVTFRSSLPKFWNMNPVDYDTIPFGDHLLWDYATGETHAPPVSTAQWMFVEMIRTYPYPPESPLADNAVQRAWGYKAGFMATRSRYQGIWSTWSVMAVASGIQPTGMPPEPTE